MRSRQRLPTPFLLVLVASLLAAPGWAQAKKPNVVCIMGDDIGWFNIGA